MENLITIKIEDLSGASQDIIIPTDVSLSLMEILRASEYDILATCGGMALCATCHIEIVKGLEGLAIPEDHELDMLDTLPDADENSRLSCQIRLNQNNNGLSIKIKGSLNHRE